MPLNLYLFGGSTISIVVVTLLAFSVLQWFHIPAGNFLDWVIGGASFWWLLVIVTVPWNIHFKAKETFFDAKQSIEKAIPVGDKQLDYVKLLVKRSLIVAIFLHILSAIGLYILAATGISAVGYISSGAALLLTGLRPAISAYEYLYQRLTTIGKELRYPREDIVELRHRFTKIEQTVQRMEKQLNPENPDSLEAKQKVYLQETRRELANIAANIEELRATNKTEHERISRESQQAIAQLSTDGQFLEHVREIIRFFKAA
ncbi:hypothetical protein [Rivularia sp. UHCC 0363]|uniref:hypothetical protein n=1 Tax=Rivularia sp. UHCC 0363 TaxID=3110244 RepID=UPI002B1F3169|nr:hypothetical protein [Rivularia sp. UHCC 0363]MEA5597227.1 hypothetical protein [Rivularia sp. UHCC 0363]